MNIFRLVSFESIKYQLISGTDLLLVNLFMPPFILSINPAVNLLCTTLCAGTREATINKTQSPHHWKKEKEEEMKKIFYGLCMN